MPSTRRVFLLLLLMPLGGCGFHPLYAKSERAQQASELASIKVAPIANRLGQLLEFSLRENFNPQNVPVAQRYTLNVTLTIQQNDLGILRDATATFGEVIVNAEFSLMESKTGQRVFTGRTSVTGSFNIPNDAFAAQVATDDARERTVGELTNQISTRLIFFLRQSRAG